MFVKPCMQSFPPIFDHHECDLIVPGLAAASDVNPTNSILNFLTGESRNEIRVSILPDNDAEGPEVQ